LVPEALLARELAIGARRPTDVEHAIKARPRLTTTKYRVSNRPKRVRGLVRRGDLTRQ